MSLEKYKSVKVGLGIPHSGVWLVEFATSLMNMFEYCRVNRMGEYKHQMVQTIACKGSILPKQRREIVLDAQKLGMTHLLWLDSDHSFPKDMLHRLMHHGKQIVAVNHVTKKVPANPTARYAPRPGTDDNPGGTPVFSDDDKHGLERVWRVGCGTMLVDMKVFEKTGPNIFHMYYREDVDTYQGEDWSMCEAFEAAGIPIFVDHDISRECGHIGYLEFNHSLVGEVVRQPVQEVA